jgi:hypothetical protein
MLLARVQLGALQQCTISHTRSFPGSCPGTHCTAGTAGMVERALTNSVGD